VIPTVIANAFFLPRHLLPHDTSGSDPKQTVQPSAAAEEV